MTAFGFRRCRAARGIGILVVALFLSAALAAAASAATLTVKVTPAKIHQRKTFLITITGTYKRSELKGTAWLIAFDQFNDMSPCKRSASNEAKKPSARRGRFADRAAGSPQFAWAFRFKAGTAGSRRVCAYLFPTRNTTGRGRSLKSATATFRVRS